MKNMVRHVVAGILAFGAIVCILASQTNFTVPFILGAVVVELYSD